MTISICTVFYLLGEYVLLSFILLSKSILSESIDLTIAIAMGLVLFSTIDYLISLVGLTIDEDSPSMTSRILDLFNLPPLEQTAKAHTTHDQGAKTHAQEQGKQAKPPFVVFTITGFHAAVCLGPYLRDLEIDDVSFESLCTTGLSLGFLISKSYVEGKIADVVVRWGLETVRRWKGRKDSGDTDIEAENREEKEM